MRACLGDYAVTDDDLVVQGLSCDTSLEQRSGLRMIVTHLVYACCDQYWYCTCKTDRWLGAAL